jgi:hypothetical protein
MRKKQMSLMDPAEAAVLDQITVRRIEPAEQDRWNQLVSQHHYLKNASLVGAINARSGRTLGVEAVADKSNEIPATQTLLGRLELDGVIALMDALHTQVKTARSVVQEGGGDFVLFVKGNQAGLLAQAQHFLPEDFFPSTAAR